MYKCTTDYKKNIIYQQGSFTHQQGGGGWGRMLFHSVIRGLRVKKAPAGLWMISDILLKYLLFSDKMLLFEIWSVKTRYLMSIIIALQWKYDR